MEEIRDAGLEMPAVNQIEVNIYTLDVHDDAEPITSCTRSASKNLSLNIVTRTI
jgi:hypothetical protein